MATYPMPKEFEQLLKETAESFAETTRKASEAMKYLGECHLGKRKLDAMDLNDILHGELLEESEAVK
jgi:hypothetical protein